MYLGPLRLQYISLSSRLLPLMATVVARVVAQKWEKKNVFVLEELTV